MREQLAFRPSQLESAFDQLLRGPDAPLREAAILSTCNRVEVYGVASDPAQAHAGVIGFLHTFHQLMADSVASSLYTLAGNEAVEHLFATACGLNSLVIGEV